MKVRLTRTEAGLKLMSGNGNAGFGWVTFLEKGSQQEVRSLGWKDPLEKGSYPLQYSGLENSMDCV